MFVHNQDMEALYKHVPKDIMPAEYGGNGGTLSEITGKQPSPFWYTSSYFYGKNIDA